MGDLPEFLCIWAWPRMGNLIIQFKSTYRNDGICQNILIFGKISAKLGTHAHIWVNVFGHNSAFFVPIQLKLFVGGYYYLSYDWSCEIQAIIIIFTLIFRTYFYGKIDVATTRAPNDNDLTVWVLLTQLKSLTTGRTFWVNCYLEIMFTKFSCLRNLIVMDHIIKEFISRPLSFTL